jgi:gas vesicle protein
MEIRKPDCNLKHDLRILHTEDGGINMRHKEFWIALGVGAAIGGVAALLYAPQTGTATRKKLKRGLEDLGDTLEDAGEYLKEQAERLGKEAQKLIEASKDQFDDAIDSASKSANKAAKAVTKLV